MGSDLSAAAAAHSHQYGTPRRYFSYNIQMLLIYLVTSLTLGDGHIWHQISVVGIAEG